MSSKLMVCNLFLVCLIGYTWDVYGLQGNQQKAISLGSEVVEDAMHGEKREEIGGEPPLNKADSLSKNEKREDELVEDPPPDAESLHARELHSRWTFKRQYCRDYSQHCGGWARTGECCVNPGYMHNYCRKSCNLCGRCEDLSQNCKAWRRNCSTHKTYMHTFCKRTCRKC